MTKGKRLLGILLIVLSLMCLWYYVPYSIEYYIFVRSTMGYIGQKQGWNIFGLCVGYAFIFMGLFCGYIVGVLGERL